MRNNHFAYTKKLHLSIYGKFVRHVGYCSIKNHQLLQADQRNAHCCNFLLQKQQLTLKKLPNNELLRLSELNNLLRFEIAYTRIKRLVQFNLQCIKFSQIVSPCNSSYNLLKKSKICSILTLFLLKKKIIRNNNVSTKNWDHSNGQ